MIEVALNGVIFRSQQLRRPRRNQSRNPRRSAKPLRRPPLQRWRPQLQSLLLLHQLEVITSLIQLNIISADNLTTAQEDAVTAISAMGYPRDQVRFSFQEIDLLQVIAALRAAFFNSDRAVEYLLSGIPEGAGLEDPANLEDAIETEEGEPGGLLAFLFFSSGMFRG